MNRFGSSTLQEGRKNPQLENGSYTARPISRFVDHPAMSTISSYINGVSTSTPRDRKISADSLVDESDIISDLSFYDLPQIKKEPIQSSRLRQLDLKKSNRAGSANNSIVSNGRTKPQFYSGSARINGTETTGGIQPLVTPRAEKQKAVLLNGTKKGHYGNNGALSGNDSEIILSSSHRNGLTKPVQHNSSLEEILQLSSATVQSLVTSRAETQNVGLPNGTKRGHYGNNGAFSGNGLTEPVQHNSSVEEILQLSSAAETESTCSSGIAADIESSPRSGTYPFSRVTNGLVRKYIPKEANRTTSANRSISRETPVRARHIQSNVSLLNNGSYLIGDENYYSKPARKSTHWNGSAQKNTPASMIPNTEYIYLEYSDTNYGQHLRDAQIMSVHNKAEGLFGKGYGSLDGQGKYNSGINTANGRTNEESYLRSDQKPPLSMAVDGTKGQSAYGELSLMNSFSVDSSRRISSAVWAMKLLDGGHHTPSSPSYQQMLLKARIFRRWHQRVRLRRLIRMEIDSKMNSAVTYWQYSILSKHFTAWHGYRLKQQQAADQLYRRHMMQTGLRGLRFVVQFNAQARHDAHTRLNGLLMAKYWLKWQSHLKARQAETLRTSFHRWRVFKLEGNRDKILDGMARRHILTRNYSKWKTRYHVEQSDSVANLHFKITLVTKCWHNWRMYTAEQVVKTRLKEVARVHYENHVQARLFYLWVEHTKKASTASSLLKRKIVVKAFYSWKNWTEYAKVIHQRFQCMCKEYYNRALVKQSFVKWKQKLLARQADKYHRVVMERRVYRLWFLRFRRKVIHRHLCKAMAKKGKKRRFFRLWLDATRSQHERRANLVTTLQRILLKNTLSRWREHAISSKSLRTRMDLLVQRKDDKVARRAMDKWLFAIKVVNFTKMARIRWSARCVRKACDEWKLLVRRNHLEQALIESRPTQDLWTIRAAFAQWKKAHQEEAAVQQRARSAAAILARNTKRRVLQAWRVTNQQDQIIAPKVARKRRKYMARAFDAWRLYIYRQKYIVDQHVRSKEKIVLRHFMYWRGRTQLVLKERDAADKLQQSKIRRAFAAWRGHVRECRHERLKERAQRLQLLQAHFKHWVERTHVRLEAREVQLGYQARQVLLMRWSFKSWRKTASQQKQRLAHAETQVSANHRRIAVASSFRDWLRLHQVTQIVRDHAETRRTQLLQRVFAAWCQFIKDEVQKQVRIFNTALSLDASFGSNLGSTFRSTLGSNTLGSTLGSSSDFLSSSGYGGAAGTRRGSGSVFPFPSPRLTTRDDDVASLPGRMDHVEVIRMASPITVLRESGNAHTRSPLAFQSPLAVPSPPCHSPSPEFHLQLPSEVSDSVFTPVRPDRKSDDTLPMIGSFSSEDDEYERQSVTSGMSCMSMRDKEMVLTDTILHWRSLPLSLTFRTWLKYTRQQKLLRELLYYIREKRGTESMAKALKTWRRELYIKVVARQHLRDGTRLRCLLAWHGYVRTCRKKEERNLMAQQQCRTRLIRINFQHWRNKFTAKRRLQSILGQWQKKAIVEEKYKSIGDKVQANHERRELKVKFQYWLDQTKKSQEAKAFYLEMLLPRFFTAWHGYASTRANDRRNAAALRERTLTRTAFNEWQRRFIVARKTEQFLEVKETNYCLEILKSWHQWANGVNTRRTQWRSFRRSVEVKTMRDIFSVWLTAAQQLQNSTRVYEQSLVRRVFVSWRATVHARVQHQFSAQEFSVQRSQNLVSRCFKFWQRLYAHRQVAIAHADQRDMTSMRECYREWRDFTLECRAEKHFLNNVIKKVYYRWYDNCVARKKARHLIKSWKNITEDSKNLNSKAMEVCQQSERKLLHRAFTLWIQEAHKLERAKSHSRTIAMRCALIAWHQHASTRVRCTRLLAEHQEKYQRDLVSKSFILWRESFRTNVDNLEILEEHLEKKGRETLAVCMLKWRKNTLKCRAEKHCVGRLVYKSFEMWKERLRQKRGLEDIMHRMFTRRTRQAAYHWRQWTTRVKRQRREAEGFRDELMQLRLTTTFAHWKHATEQSQAAKRQHSRLLLTRGIATWQSVVKAKIEERHKIEQFQRQVMERKVARMFKHWTVALKEAQNYGKLVSGQLQKHNQRMLAGAMRQWRKDALRSRAEKHYGTMLTARFFLDWKTVYDDRVEQKQQEMELVQVADEHYRQRLCKLCFRSWMYDARVERHLEMKQQRLVQTHFYVWKKKTSLKAIAGELGDQRLYAKYWNKWRHQLVRKRVSELMMKHEEKKLLSEVFGGWLRLTTIRRRLLKEWNVAEIEKWFRLWMQKYNDS